MKPGDKVLLDRLEPATVKTVRTPIEMSNRLPMLAEIFWGAAECGADLVAIVALDDRRDPGHATTVIVHTAAGWETIDGTPIEVELLNASN